MDGLLCLFRTEDVFTGEFVDAGGADLDDGKLCRNKEPVQENEEEREEQVKDRL